MFCMVFIIELEYVYLIMSLAGLQIRKDNNSDEIILLACIHIAGSVIIHVF